jgi:two-component system nitrogen regulation response regulator NtrX
MDYSWPGNVRELQNFMERLFIMAEDSVIEAKTVYSYLPEGAACDDGRDDAAQGSLKEAVLSFEKELIERKLKEHSYHITETARALQLERSHLYKKIKSLGIRTP